MSDRNRCEKIMIKGIGMMSLTALLAAFILVCSGFVLGCGGDDPPTGNDQIDYNAQKQGIVELYHLWSEKLKLQDYDGAINLTTPGAGAFRFTQTAKEAWDRGDVNYWEFSYILANWNADYAEMGYAEVYGNVVFYQYSSSSGELIDSMGFASKCQRQGDKWRIDTFRWDYELYWWTR
ncbi:MAG: hypothetical protein ABII79_00930 [bacterium]